ncbi:hypothetical protein OH76DRAFT_1422127 [Lentinus brumalis]|uniref:DUF6535 domain-containing protein n=1 Tax=Lentinus brumalis TaxID=2498619 RepID=A0A371CSA7_9APHY|nr:hypothetical protein OH76DRAFT_1422127 [Polyporus brumalis]
MTEGEKQRRQCQTDQSEDSDIKADYWSDAAEAVKSYHDELVDGWKEDMDTLLVYAGLFSAVLTAFNVQSYQLLQPAPTDPTLAVLQQISAQLNSFTITPAFVNSTQPARQLNENQLPFQAPTSAVWINIQWLHGLGTGLSGTSRESARLRQYRLNGLLKWRVGTVVVLLPILLQIALILFLMGLVILLWTLHGTVAAVTSSLVGVLLVFSVVVTLLPAFRWDCSYRSPQALVAYELIRAIYNPARAFILGLLIRSSPLSPPMPRREVDPNASNPNVNQLIAAIEESLDWMVWNRFPEMPTWRGREQLAISSPHISHELDRDVAVMAYTTTFATSHLKRAPTFFSDLGRDQVAHYIDHIWSVLERHWGNGNMSVSGRRIGDIFQQLPLQALRFMLSAAPESRDKTWTRDVRSLLSRLRYMPRVRSDCEDYLQTLSELAISVHDNAIATDALNWVILDLRYAEDPSMFPEEVLQNVMAVSDRIMQEYEHSNCAPHAYIYAVETIVHCVRLTTCAHSTSDPEHVQLVRQRGRDALKLFCDVLRRREASGTPLIRTSDYLDGALLASLPVVLQAIAEYRPTVDGVADVLERLADLHLDGQAEQEARALEERLAQHMGNVALIPTAYTGGSRWTTCYMDVISDTESAKQDEIVAFIPPNPGFPGTKPVESVRMRPGPSFPRADCVHTSSSRFVCGFMDHAGLPEAPPAIDKVLRRSVVKGEVEENEIDNIKQRYSALLKECDLAKSVPAMRDPFRDLRRCSDESTDGCEEDRDDDLITEDAAFDDFAALYEVREDHNGPLIPLVEASLDIAQRFPHTCKLTTPADFLAEVHAVQDIIARALRRQSRSKKLEMTHAAQRSHLRAATSPPQGMAV